MPTRRTLLGLAVLLAARRVLAFGDAARLTFAQVRHGGRWDPRPDGLSRLAWEIAKRTSIETSPAVKSIALADPELFRFPFAVLSSDQAFPAPADNEIAELRRYLSYGGFLMVDDASGTRGGGFEQSARQLVSRIVPGRIKVRRGKTPPSFKIQYPTPAGLKCLYTGTGTVQEVFLICSNANEAKKWLVDEGTVEKE